MAGKFPIIWKDRNRIVKKKFGCGENQKEKVRYGEIKKKRYKSEKIGKLLNVLLFQYFGAPEGRKVGSLKRRVQR